MPCVSRDATQKRFPDAVQVDDLGPEAIDVPEGGMGTLAGAGLVENDELDIQTLPAFGKGSSLLRLPRGVCDEHRRPSTHASLMADELDHNRRRTSALRIEIVDYMEDHRI
jgi:hypothetical protein